MPNGFALVAARETGPQLFPGSKLDTARNGDHITPMKNTATGTKHSHSCTMAFGRYSAPATCPRCDELRNGAPARADFVRHRRPSAAERDARFARELREHRAACHCGPVCTFGDW